MLTEVCLKIVESIIVEPSSVNIHLIRIRSTIDRPYYGEWFFLFLRGLSRLMISFQIESKSQVLSQ